MNPIDQPSNPLSEVDVLMAANAELNAKMANMRLVFEHEAAQFKATLQGEFSAAFETASRAAQAEKHDLHEQLAATIARLEGLENKTNLQPDVDMPQESQTGQAGPRAPDRHQQRTRDPRIRHPETPTKDPRTRPQATPSPGVPPTPPDSTSTSTSPPPPVNAHSSPPPRSTPSAAPPRSSSNTPPKTSKSSSPSPKGKKTAKSPRKPAEYQMLRDETPKDAHTIKIAFNYHIRFFWGCLDSKKPPTSATPEIVAFFNLRFQGLSVTDLRRLGQLGPTIIDPAHVKVGLSLEESIRSKNKIISAFYKVEESAILHMRTYLAKLGIHGWAPDFSQTPYSLYNMTMRTCIIDTFRFLVAGTHYDFLRPNTRLVNDTAMLSRLYDHFVHHYMFDKFKMEIRTPGGNEDAAARNTASQGRLRLHKTRAAYLKDAGAPAGVRLMISLKATSDDEGAGTNALARAERSQDADRVLRTVDSLIVEDLYEQGKKIAAKNRLRRVAPPFGQRRPSRFLEVPKGMPIQYYDPTWFNSRPPHTRAKIAPKIIVAFVPGSTDFFSRSTDNRLDVKALTEKYGAHVFNDYDLDYFNLPNGTTAGGDGSGDSASNADSDDSGESVGTHDSDHESIADDISIGSFISDDGLEGEGEAAFSGSEAAFSGSEEEGDNNHMAGFAAAYDVPMTDLQNALFDGTDSDSD
ncbi:hypothetical protein C8R43DRAFT_1003896 [Mycena crocata]|nr:hypothetical protein C8R43DRAFT_1003896 [Mycena crocata]